MSKPLRRHQRAFAKLMRKKAKEQASKNSDSLFTIEHLEDRVMLSADPILGEFIFSEDSSRVEKVVDSINISDNDTQKDGITYKHEEAKKIVLDYKMLSKKDILSHKDGSIVFDINESKESFDSVVEDIGYHKSIDTTVETVSKEGELVLEINSTVLEGEKSGFELIDGDSIVLSK
jgi:hydrogenase maturation factor HypF (carbamoyltransferase family)